MAVSGLEMSCQSITSSCHVTFKGCNYPHHSDMRPKSLEGRGLVGCLRETAECFSGPEMQRETSESLATGRTVSCYQKSGNKSSAVAEMGDRGHNRHGPKRGGLLCPPPSRGAGFPSNAMWPRSTSVPSGVFVHPAVWPQ